MSKRSEISLKLKLFICTAGIALAVLLLFSPLGRWSDLFLFDTFFLLEPERKSTLDVVVVTIDERSFDELQLQWPWPRAIHGKLVDTLREAGVAAIAFDLLFAEPSAGDNDQQFADAIARFGKVVLASNIEELYDEHVGFSEGFQVIEPLPILSRVQGEVYTGIVRYSLDIDGFLRKTNTTQNEFPSFAQAVAEIVSKERGQPIVRESGEKAINYLGPSKTVQHIPYYQALDPSLYLPDNFFKDKVVLVGFASATEANVGSAELDHFAVPYSRWRGGLMAGVEIHAHVLNNIWNKTLIELGEFRLIVLVGVFLALIGGLIFLTIKPATGIFIFALILLSLLVTSIYLFIFHYTYISPVGLAFPMLVVYLISPFAHYLAARKQRNFIKDAFSTYLAPSVVNALIESSDGLELGGQERNASIMFLDISGFTAFAEKLTPQQLIDVMNRNLGAFAEIILKHDGMIDKYIGDCIMAIWGVPLLDAKHQEKCCLAALEMEKELARLLLKEEKLSGVKFSIRIGINSGDVIAGNVGGGQRFNYTVLGDPVNLASRLEAVNKYYGTKAIISENTQKVLGEKFIVRELDKILVVGKQLSIPIFELVGLKGEVSEDKARFIADYHNALSMYRNRNWQGAEIEFEKLLQQNPEDKASKILAERSREFLNNPPPADWDGVYQMDKK